MGKGEEGREEDGFGSL